MPMISTSGGTLQNSTAVSANVEKGSAKLDLGVNEYTTKLMVSKIENQRDNM